MSPVYTQDQEASTRVHAVMQAQLGCGNQPMSIYLNLSLDLLVG